MRVVTRGSELDLHLIMQAGNAVRADRGVEAIRRNIERSAEERVQQALQNAKVSNDELQRIIQEIKRKLDYLNRYLEIDIDDQLEIPVVKIFERDTNRLIRQIPPEHLLELMKRIDQMLGVLLNERV
jgi:flagellar protein FlaG